jgi:hypothetical protein
VSTADEHRERDARELPDGRSFARRANVVVAVSALAAGMTATLLGAGASPSALAGTSADEQRALAALPPLTWSSVAEGEFTGAVEAYLADRFTLRQPLLGVDAAMRRARGFAPGEDDVVVYSVSAEAMDLGADPSLDLDTEENDHLALTAPSPRLAADPAVERDEAEEGAETSSARQVTTRFLSAGILIRDGRAMQSFGGGPSGAPAYARSLNTIHAAVGNRATVYSVIVPTAQEFYLPEGARNRVRYERPNILGTYARLSPGIRTVDVHAELAAHTAENLYFNTDHHWTGLGAYYGYRAFCRSAGLDPVPLERMDRRVVRERWLGSLFRLTRDPDLRADRVEIAVPPAEAEVHVPGRGSDRIVPLFRHESPGYEVFLGGDHPIMRVRTSMRNGRRAILVKNSYGNAFAPYLVSHYEELVFVDYRSYGGTLRRLLAESERPTDLIFMNGTLTANSRAHTALIERLLDGRG